MIFTKLHQNVALAATATAGAIMVGAFAAAALNTIPAEAQLPPPVSFTAIVCEEAGVEVTYEAARYDLPGAWWSRGGRIPAATVNAWRIDLGNGEEVVTTAPCRLTRPAR